MNPKDLVGAKKASLRYVPPALMIEASGPMQDGAVKYGPFNWREQPVEVVTYVEAILRHLFAYLDGQDNAEDSGHSHIGHAIAGLGILADATANGSIIDNRVAGPAADMLRARDMTAKANTKLVLFSTDPDMERGLRGADDPASWAGRPWCDFCTMPYGSHGFTCPNNPINGGPQ